MSVSLGSDFSLPFSPAKPFGPFLVLVALCVGVYSVAPQTMAQEKPPNSDVIPPERQPYDVRLLVAFDSATFDSNESAEILHDVERTAQRCVGELWSIQTTAISWLGPVNTLGLERLDRSFLARRFPGESADIWFVACIESLSVGTRVSVRSWQPEVEMETVAVSVDILDRREIPVAISRLCRDLMRPMGVVENVDRLSVRVRLRAGELSPADPSFVQLTQGDLLLPLLAYRDKNKNIERLQTIPWTYISVDELDGSTVLGTIQSGLKLALGGKTRGRIDTLVVALRPQYPATRIELLTQSKPPLPLVAHRIEVRTSAAKSRPTKDHPDIDPKATLIDELLTDRRGLSRVSVQADRRFVWLFAFSGEHLLARVPVVPGISPSLRLEVPDDATRLTAEADLQMLQGEVIDAVALRNTAIATMRAAAKKDDWATVNQKLRLLKQQLGVSQLNDRLNAVRVAGTTAAKARKDKVAEARIHRICDDTALLIKTHLGDDKIRIVVEEMESLQMAETPQDKP